MEKEKGIVSARNAGDNYNNDREEGGGGGGSLKEEEKPGRRRGGREERERGQKKLRWGETEHREREYSTVVTRWMVEFSHSKEKRKRHSE